MTTGLHCHSEKCSQRVFFSSSSLIRVSTIREYLNIISLESTKPMLRSNTKMLIIMIIIVIIIIKLIAIESLDKNGVE